MKDEHESEIDWLKNLRHYSYEKLRIELQFQCCEEWRKIAVQREMGRRLIGTKLKFIR